MDFLRQDEGVSFTDSEEFGLFMGGAYTRGDIIGSGAFGNIFQVSDDNHAVYAVKRERHPRSRLQKEFTIYKDLWEAKRSSEKNINIPQVHIFGTHSGEDYLVMELLGKSLRDWQLERQWLSKETVLMIGIQCLHLLEFIHEQGILHRDIKPANILTGRGPSGERKVYIVDFGLAQRTISSWESYSTKDEEIVPFSGTPMFASPRGLAGNKQNRLDDLQSLAYSMIQLATGYLPWRYVDERNTRLLENAELGAQRSRFSAKELCRDFEELTPFVRMVSKTGTFKPDYDALREILEDALKNRGRENDGMFDWVQDSREFKTRQRTKCSRVATNHRKDMSQSVIHLEMQAKAKGIRYRRELLHVEVAKHLINVPLHELRKEQEIAESSKRGQPECASGGLSEICPQTFGSRVASNTLESVPLENESRLGCVSYDQIRQFHRDILATPRIKTPLDVRHEEIQETSRDGNAFPCRETGEPSPIYRSRDQSGGFKIITFLRINIHPGDCGLRFEVEKRARNTVVLPGVVISPQNDMPNQQDKTFSSTAMMLRSSSIASKEQFKTSNISARNDESASVRLHEAKSEHRTGTFHCRRKRRLLSRVLSALAKPFRACVSKT